MQGRGFSPSKSTIKFPALVVSIDKNWRHLSGLRLANSQFGVPGNIDVLLGVDMFCLVVHQGWRQGPPGFPVALKTCFGRILSGIIRYNCRQRRQVPCVSSVLASYKKLRKLSETRNTTVCRFCCLEFLLRLVRKFSGLRKPNP